MGLGPIEQALTLRDYLPSRLHLKLLQLYLCISSEVLGQPAIMESDPTANNKPREEHLTLSLHLSTLA
jgi:hypothetical protein